MDFGLLASILGIRLGQLAFGGGLLWGTLLLSWSNRADVPGTPAAVDRAYLDLSLATSVGLTLLVFSTIVHHYLALGSFSLPLETPQQVLTAIGYGVFFLLWVHWGYVEIVILHRFRSELPAGNDPVPESFRLTRVRLRNAHGLQFTLFLLMIALETAVLVGGGLHP